PTQLHTLSLHDALPIFNLADYFRANKMKIKTVTFGTADDTVKAYEAGRCDVFTTDQSGLYAERLRFAKPEDHMVLPEIISKEPLDRKSTRLNSSHDQIS